MRRTGNRSSVCEHGKQLYNSRVNRQINKGKSTKNLQQGQVKKNVRGRSHTPVVAPGVSGEERHMVRMPPIPQSYVVPGPARKTLLALARRPASAPE